MLGSWRLLCSSFLLMTCSTIRHSDILPKRGLHRSLQVLWRSRRKQNLTFTAERSHAVRRHAWHGSYPEQGHIYYLLQLTLHVSLYTEYIHVSMLIDMISIYIYIWMEGERERERERKPLATRAQGTPKQHQEANISCRLPRPRRPRTAWQDPRSLSSCAPQTPAASLCWLLKVKDPSWTGASCAYRR